MSDWSSPSTLALLGAAGGFLDPNGGPASAVQLGMQGMMAGNQMQQQKAAAAIAQRKLTKQMEIEDTLRSLAEKHGADTVGFARALSGSQYPELIKLGIDMAKAKSVKSFIKGKDAEGNPTYYAGYNTGEMSPTGVTPSDRLMQINRGSQIDLADPYSGVAQKSLGVGIGPGQSAQLAQSQNQFNMSHALAQQNSALNQYKAAMDYNPEFQAQKAESIARAKTKGNISATAESNLPGATTAVKASIQAAQDLLDHPGFDISVGGKSPAGYLASFVPNTDAGDWKARFEQIEGKTYLGGIEALRGFGPVTEKEGLAAGQAYARLKRTTSQKEFLIANKEFQDAMKAGLAKIAGQAGAQTPDVTPINNFTDNKDGWGDLK
jgi:hypothetical protein